MRGGTTGASRSAGRSTRRVLRGRSSASGRTPAPGLTGSSRASGRSPASPSAVKPRSSPRAPRTTEARSGCARRSGATATRLPGRRPRFEPSRGRARRCSSATGRCREVWLPAPIASASPRGTGPGIRRGVALLTGFAEPLVEEAGEEQDAADGEERERPRHRVQPAEVVEEDLRQADAEDREPGQAKPLVVALEPDVERDQAERAPHGADRRMPALERGVDVRTELLGEPEEPERRRIDAE